MNKHDTRNGLEYASVTTLNRIRAAKPCEEGWRTLLATLGKSKADDEPLELSTVLDSNGLDDALWVLSYAMPDDRLARHFQAWCAEQVLHIFEAGRPNDTRVRNQIAMLRNDGVTPEQWAAAGAAARAAARAAAAAWDAAWAAARAAAWDAASAAAWDAARAAAAAGAWDAARAAAAAGAAAGAWAAARAAAWDAASAAARDADWDAAGAWAAARAAAAAGAAAGAWAAARDAAWDAQERQFRAMIAMKKGQADE